MKTDIPHESMCIHYCLPAGDVIQKKSITLLGDRLREQGIVPGEFGLDFAQYVAEYEALPNTADVRKDQEQRLQILLMLLQKRLDENGEDLKVRTALCILQDELYFVSRQTLAPPADSGASGGFGDAADFGKLQNPWDHLSESPFLRMVAELARRNAANYAAGCRKGLKAAVERVPAGEIPTQKDFSAWLLIRALSRHHKRQLLSGVEKDDDAGRLYEHVKARLNSEGMLSHYSHKPNLKVLHSTDYLKASRMLDEEGVDKSVALDAAENVSKSQLVDTERFRNTGFVFFFLEGRNSPRRHTDFGDYRYTLPLAECSGILADSWAILHDLAGCSQCDRKIRSETAEEQEGKKGGTKVTRRLIESLNEIDQAYIKKLAGALATPLKSYLAAADQKNVVETMLALFLPTSEQRILLQTPDGRKHDTGIRDHLSGNFLQGSDIIEGIALRIVHDLMTLRKCSSREYEAVMNDDTAFWEYVSVIVHDVQVMVPHDVLLRD